MRRLLFALVVLSGLIYGSLSSLPAASIEANTLSRTVTFAPASPQDGHTIKITPSGPTQEMIDAAKARVLKHPAIKDLLNGAEYRMISFQMTESVIKKPDVEPPDGFKATIFDYTKNRAFLCSGRFEGGELDINSVIDQPDPDAAEFDAAVEVAARDEALGAAIKTGELQPYRPMPPLVNSDSAVGKLNRTIAVGLLPRGIKYHNQIVGVDMIAKKVVRFPGNAPTAAAATVVICGLNDDPGHSASGRGLAGQAEIVISRAGVEIWRFTVVRPSASSGTKASAVELLNVNYRGKRMLTRAHVPILNVKYEKPTPGNPQCGPYRDWQYDEGFFSAIGTDVPGTNGAIRMCSSPPQTILESGNDVGNFRGVAIYDNREEVVVVSELEASWYRYISQWTFTDSGVIKPRFGFGSVRNSCVCDIHTHHVYWRLDFDINTAVNNRVIENNPSGSFDLKSEGMRARVDRLNQTWTILNSVSGESVVLRPGPWDGNFDKYGKGDVWLLLSKSNEIDDGVSCTTCSASFINLVPFTNGESTFDTDVVVWYGAHFNHINGNVACGTAAGPDIEVKQW